eukprot:1142528-Pelagomonas_calceolata.AAC.1
MSCGVCVRARAFDIGALRLCTGGARNELCVCVCVCAHARLTLVPSRPCTGGAGNEQSRDSKAMRIRASEVWTHYVAKTMPTNSGQVHQEELITPHLLRMHACKPCSRFAACTQCQHTHCQHPNEACQHSNEAWNHSVADEKRNKL